MATAEPAGGDLPVADGQLLLPEQPRQDHHRAALRLHARLPRAEDHRQQAHAARRLDQRQRLHGVGALQIGKLAARELPAAHGADHLGNDQGVAGEPQRVDQVGGLVRLQPAAAAPFQKGQDQVGIVARAQTRRQQRETAGPRRQTLRLADRLPEEHARLLARRLHERRQDAERHGGGLDDDRGLLVLVQQAQEEERVLVAAHAAQRHDRRRPQGPLLRPTGEAAERLQDLVSVFPHRVARLRVLGDPGGRGRAAQEAAHLDHAFAVALPPHPPLGRPPAARADGAEPPAAGRRGAATPAGCRRAAASASRARGRAAPAVAGGRVRVGRPVSQAQRSQERSDDSNPHLAYLLNALRPLRDA
jgi:hypothetical protein